MIRINPSEPAQVVGAAREDLAAREVVLRWGCGGGIGVRVRVRVLGVGRGGRG